MEDVNDYSGLGQLPSDVLVSILEKLHLREAVRTAVLSRRWRRLYAQVHLPRFPLDIHDFVHRRVTPEEQAQALVQAATSLLTSRSANHPISTLAVRFVLLREGDSDNNPMMIVEEAVAVGKVRAVDLTVMTEKDDIHVVADDEEEYGRRFRSLYAACPRAFAALTALSLENIKLAAAADFPTLIAACTNLQFLSLTNCSSRDPHPTPPLEIRHSNLVHLTIAYCPFSVLDLQCLPRLVRFALCDWTATPRSWLPLNFGHLPRLATLSLTCTPAPWHQPLYLTDLLANTAVTHLRINLRGARNIWVKPESPSCNTRLRRVLRNVKDLKIRNVHDGCDLSWTLFLLQAAPLLEDLYVKFWQSHACMEDDEPHLRKESDFTWHGRLDAGFSHNGLTRLTISGFRSSDERVIQYLRRVVEMAPRLEVVHLHDMIPCEYCDAIAAQCSTFPQTDEDKDLIRNNIIGAGSSRSINIKFITN
uniref:F-box domain-containing protein n=1 Tax=Oryza punctata TaxID=4537 RepID=A0A0E0LQJ8_ORYPU